MAIYLEDLVDIELGSGTIHRSFMNHSIGEADKNANRFGIRAFRNGASENLGAAVCTGYFIKATGETVIIPGTVSDNTAYVTLPQTCYATEGQFSLAIKLAGGDITSTVRIVDGIVANTTTDTVIDPGEVIPDINDLLELIEEAEAVIQGSIRYDIEQELTSAQRTQARDNIGMVSIEFVQISGNEYQMNVSTKCEFVNTQDNEYTLVLHAD